MDDNRAYSHYEDMIALLSRFDVIGWQMYFRLKRAAKRITSQKEFSASDLEYK